MRTIDAEAIDSRHLILREPLPEDADEIIVKIKRPRPQKGLSEGAEKLLAFIKAHDVGEVFDISRESIYEDID
ncbi:MAG: hypothetical protein ACUVXI_04105 [bacterium]